MRNWKRLIAAAGTAALLISNLGSISQAVFATEPVIEAAEIPGSENAENTEPPSDNTENESNTITLDVTDLIGGLGDEAQTPPPVVENEGNANSEGGAAQGNEPAGDPTDANTPSGTTGESQNGTLAGEQGQNGAADDAGNVNPPAEGSDAGNTGDGSDVVNPEAPAVNPENPDNTLNPDGTPIEPENPDDIENPGGEEEPAEETYALDDSLELTLETKESSNHDIKRGDNGDYLYNLGETASTTLTLTNPADYSLEETDGAIIRVYMQFKDTAASEIDGVPYKDESKVNEDVEAADVADLIASDAANASVAETATTTEGTETTADDTTVTPVAETTKPTPYNGSLAKTQKATEQTVAATSGTSYTYTVSERGDGLYEYEFERPIHGDTYTLELTSTYGKDTTGGVNTIWAEIVPGEDDEADDAAAEETTSEDAENAGTSDESISEETATDTEETADTESSEEQENNETSENKQHKTEIRKTCEQTLRWVVDVNLVAKKTTQTAETENYTVSVTYGADSQLPSEAQLRVIEYGPETEVYQRITEQTGESYDWLLDISFYYNDLQLEPQAPISLSVVAKAVTEEPADDADDDADEESGIALASLDAEEDDRSDDKSGDAIDVSDIPLEDTITTITHFADAGTEILEDDKVEVMANDEGQVETSFDLGSLSLVGKVSYRPATVVSASGFTDGGEYLIYKVVGDYVYFLVYHNNTACTFRVDLDKIVLKDGTPTADNITALDSTIYLNKESNINGYIIGSSSSWEADLLWSQLCWTNVNGQLKSTYSGQYLVVGSFMLYTSIAGSDMSATTGDSSQYVKFSGTNFLDTNYLTFSSENYYTTSNLSWNSSNVTLARTGTDVTGAEDTETAPASQNAVYTGDYDELPFAFYSTCVDESTNQLTGLEGVTYTIYDEDGNVVKTITTTKNMRVVVSATSSTTVEEQGVTKLPNGTYTMKMTEVPDGYVCDNDVWTFTVKDGAKSLGMTNSVGKLEGIIIVNKDNKLEMDKTAQVVDYADRTYQVDLTARSSIEVASIEGLNIHFVVDQSNSMLFPSGLKTTGKSLTVKDEGKNSNNKQQYTITVPSDLDTAQVYYFIQQKDSSATVYALYYARNAWYFQDASYYAKAKYRSETTVGNYNHIKTDDTIYLPSEAHSDKANRADSYTYYSTGHEGYGNDCHGAKCSNTFTGATLDIGTATIYTATNEYNRLHYLRESLSQMLQELNEIYPNTSVTLDLFTKDVFTGGCIGPYTLGGDGENGKSGLQTLIDSVGTITTDGGTRQDNALKHVYNSKHLGSNKDQEYVILITDGAPVSSGTGEYQIDVGTATDESAESGTAYKQINYWADKVKDKATLATVGLAMNEVTSGHKALAHISTNGPSVDNVGTDETSGEWWFQPKESSEITEYLCDTILKQIVKPKVSVRKGTVVDNISDSFYPIDKDTGQPVASGTRINKDGTICKNGNQAVLNDTSVGVGTIKCYTEEGENEGSWYVEWDKTSISGTTEKTVTTTETVWYEGYNDKRYGDSYYDRNTGRTYVWQTHNNKTKYWAQVVETKEKTDEEPNSFTGRVYLKAKEDFIGGNAIDTNKEATLTVYNVKTNEDGSTEDVKAGTYEYKKPNVNVRLLEMNEHYSQQTVPKGVTDAIKSPADRINELYQQVGFNKIGELEDKLTKDRKNVQNWKDTTRDDSGADVSTMHGVKVDKDGFSLAYSGVTLSDTDWTTLKSGDPVTVKYTYDEAEGAVGEFTITLVPTACDPIDGVSQTTGWGDHTATLAKGEPNGVTTLPRSPYGDNWIEKYTLSIKYTAYSLEQRDKQNQHNGATIDTSGSGSPGIVVGTAGKTTVETGLGTVESVNIHYVYAYETYELPETGGRGSLPYQLGGSAALLTSMIAGCSMWRRRRDGRRCG